MFADKQTENYYRVELEENKYAWVNKKFVEVEGVIPEKRYEGIKKLLYRETKNKYQIKVVTPQKSAYTLIEDNDNLKFQLFDNRFDPVEAKIATLPSRFKISNKYEDEVKIDFYNDRKLFGYGVEATDDGYIINIKKPPSINKKRPLKHIKVVVDPGHGGDEYGAVSFGLREKDINLQIAKILKKELRKRGAKVYITRTKDKKVPLYDRVDFALKKDADILLSIHQNALPDPKKINEKHGVGTYYYNQESLPLATAIQNRLLQATGFMDDKVNYRSFALTRPTEQLSVLIECGYLIYKPEADKLINKDFQKLIAKAIVKGCEDCLREDY
jgi:N-acetylmuramoyl-L-alanine amidase